ncbi:MAG TPA: hypothetical protein VJL84_04520 [Kiloniellales bacterium]|nr:hypothetical protein [Kiloniellales bacterium]
MVIAHSDEPLVVPAVGLRGRPHLEFTVGGRRQRIDGRFSRPHWCCFAQFPAAAQVPPGRYAARLSGDGGGTAAVELEVQPGAPGRRVLVKARNGAAEPYTVLILANAVFEGPNGQLTRDPLAADQPRFGMIVAYILEDLLTLAEDVLAVREERGAVQFETFRDPGLAMTAAHAFATSVPDPTSARPKTREIREFLRARAISADVVYVVHGMTAHSRAYAFGALDDLRRTKKTYELDGNRFEIGRFTQSPGVVTLCSNVDQSMPTALHEFGHAASDARTFVDDLYDNDGLGRRLINKKFRALATDPLPPRFATYEGRAFASATDRWPNKGYPPFTSYHAQRAVPQFPNIMDQYKGLGGRRCRFDLLTQQWFADRLDFKTAR